MTVQDFINQLQAAVADHAAGMVMNPADMNSQIVFQDMDGNDLYISIDGAGGNMYAPTIVLTVS